MVLQGLDGSDDLGRKYFESLTSLSGLIMAVHLPGADKDSLKTASLLAALGNPQLLQVLQARALQVRAHGHLKFSQ